MQENAAVRKRVLCMVHPSLEEVAAPPAKRWTHSTSQVHQPEMRLEKPHLGQSSMQNSSGHCSPTPESKNGDNLEHTAVRGAAGGPSGTTVEHLHPALRPCEGQSTLVPGRRVVGSGSGSTHHKGSHQIGTLHIIEETRREGE